MTRLQAAARLAGELRQRSREICRDNGCKGGELVRDGGALHGLDGEYYAKIMTDGRAPDSVVCWTGGGFYLKGVND